MLYDLCQDKLPPNNFTFTTSTKPISLQCKSGNYTLYSFKTPHHDYRMKLTLHALT